jgi:uncharacterized UPF0160 family protein
MRVATHSGSFHADDVFAVAALSLLDAPGFEIVRTRDPQELAAADVRVDVGQRNDPASGDFDHHQRGGAGERPNGIRYASFGLVWKAFGARLCDGGQQVADRIDEVLVQGVDANDTGQTISQPAIDGVQPFTVSHVIAAFNPNWDEPASAADKDAAFARAVELAAGIIRREIRSATAQVRAAALVRDAIARAQDPRLIELDQGLPWHRELVPTAPEALYVVYPRERDWGVQAVPKVVGEFANRKDLPAPWAGLSDAELAAVSGVPDARFCHAGRFMAVAGSREGALELARRALDHDDD